MPWCDFHSAHPNNVRRCLTMSRDDLGQQLHDKATRGAALAPEEQKQLEEWYARQDQEENAVFATTLASQSIGALQAQVDAAVAQLLAVTQRIQTQTAENEKVRQEIAVLQRQLAQKPATQPV
jgi:hypothetical protein